MSIVVIEGSNGVGKTTIIDYLSKEYDIISKKSIPDWFRKYIIFARSCEPNIQKRIYLIGHEANYNESNDNKDYVFDRFVYSTIIRLNYQLNKSVNETINEILTLNLKPKQIFYITANKETDNTEEITKKVREILQSKSALHRRLVDAFPKLQAVKIKIKDQTEKIKKEGGK